MRWQKSGQQKWTCVGKLNTFLIVVLIGVAYYLYFYKYTDTYFYMYVHRHTNAACVLPSVDAFDNSVMQYFGDLPPLDCYTSPQVVFIDSTGKFQLNKTALKLIEEPELSCTYSVIERNGDSRVVFKPEIKLKFPAYIKAEFSLITCMDKYSETVYKQLHSNIDFKSVLSKKTFSLETKQRLSVIIFGIDSLSRLTAIRTLNKTLTYIQNDLNGYVFRGQTKVGGSTLPNIVPLLTGKTLESFNKERPIQFDDFPLIWKNFSRKEYATFFSEDDPDMAIFNNDNNGFEQQPTDHYMRPFYLAQKSMHPIMYDYGINNYLHYFELSKFQLWKSSLCFGNLPKHSVLIEYYKQFLQAYSRRNKFAFSWLTEIGHNFQNLIRLADDDFVQFLKWLKNEGHLENSVFVFMGDHGPNYSAIRNTFIGRIEERMPFFSIVIPEHLKKKHPAIHKHLSANTGRLTTVFDMYETLKDILNENFAPRVLNLDLVPRGISLFQEISVNRTCLQSGIPQQHCACYSSSKVRTNDTVIKTIGPKIVTYINKLLKDVSEKCHRLTLLEIKHAEKVTSGFQRIQQAETFTFRRFFTKPDVENIKRLLVLVETLPGNGLFEATVDYNTNGSMDFVGSISRTNKYGNQSHCVSSKTLKALCYCRD